MKYEYDYPMASLTATVIPYNIKPNGDIVILLVERKFEPYKGKLCFPGGFVNLINKEAVEMAAMRELKEETGIKNIDSFSFIKASTDPNRDPRGRVVDFCYAVYVGLDILYSAKPSDDAQALAHITFSNISKSKDYTLYSWQFLQILNLAFDHKDMLFKLFEKRDWNFD